MVLSEREVWAWLLAWRRDIESVPMPTLLSVDAALALLADAGRGVDGGHRRAR